MHQMISASTTFIKSTFTDIFVDLCLKKYDYDTSVQRQSSMQNIRKDLIGLDLKNEERVFYCALIYVAATYREEISCSIIKPRDLKSLYRKYERIRVWNTAKKIRKELPEGNILKPEDFYKIIKKIRDLYLERLGMSVKNTIIELRNPWTNEAE